MTEASSPPDTLVCRYRPEHLAVFNPEERRRLLAGVPAEDLSRAEAGDEQAWRRVAVRVAWELLYRVEPELYERLIAGERLHPSIMSWLPARCARVVEVAAGTGRLTVQLAPRCERLVAVEPALALRQRLQRRIEALGAGHVQAVEGFFDAIPAHAGWADLVISCSAFTPDDAGGGERGLRELERVCAPGGLVVFVWPSGVEWLAERGYHHLSFDGEMFVDFGTAEEAVELARIFYPHAVARICRDGLSRVSYDVLGINAPRDIAYRHMPA